MTRFLKRVVLATALITLGGWITYELILFVGMDGIADWMPALIFVYLFPAGLIVRLILRFHDLAKSPSLLSKELAAIKPLVNTRTIVLWAFIVLLLVSAALAGSAGLSANMSTNVQFGWLFLASVGFFLAILLFIYTVFMFIELRDFEWQVAAKAKEQAERDGYLSRMRNDAEKGFKVDDAIDGSKRVVHGN